MQRSSVLNEAVRMDLTPASIGAFRERSEGLGGSHACPLRRDSAFSRRKQTSLMHLQARSFQRTLKAGSGYEADSLSVSKPTFSLDMWTGQNDTDRLSPDPAPPLSSGEGVRMQAHMKTMRGHTKMMALCEPRGRASAETSPDSTLSRQSL